jgi:tetratricopeptide (TPR) repeat protein
MNLTRGWLFVGKPRCLAPVCGSIAFSLLVLASPPPCLGFAQDGSSDPQAAEADVLPGGSQLGAPDLSLSQQASAKADAMAAFSRAIIAEDNADSDSALADYQKALTLDPGYTELAVKVAYELARRGDPSAGIQVLKDSIKAAPKAPLAYLYLSELYSKYLAKPDIGLKYAQQALELDPTNFASYVAVYEIYQDGGQPQKAFQVLDRAATVKSSDPQFWLQLADIRVKAYGDQPIPQDQVGKISVDFEKALALDGNTPLTLAHVADFYARSDREKEAIPLYIKAIKLSPANAPEGDDTLDAIRNSLAICFDAVGNTTGAISTLQQLIRDNPLRTDSYRVLCDLYEKTNNTESALGVCKQLTLLEPGDFRNYVREAALLMKEQKLDEAIAILTDARTKFPAEAEITYSLALALSEGKRYPDALEIFAEAVQEAADGQTEMLDAQFYRAYGEAADEAGQTDKAAGLLKKAIDLDPGNASDAYNDLGFMWVDKGQNLDEAGGLIKKALQLDPGNPAFIDSLGWYFFKKGDIPHALEQLKKAAGLIQPEDAVVDEHLGDAYNAANDEAKALDYWQRSSGIDKTNKEILVKIAGARQKLARQGTPAQTTP